MMIVSYASPTKQATFILFFSWSNVRFFCSFFLCWVLTLALVTKPLITLIQWACCSSNGFGGAENIKCCLIFEFCSGFTFVAYAIFPFSLLIRTLHLVTLSKKLRKDVFFFKIIIRGEDGYVLKAYQSTTSRPSISCFSRHATSVYIFCCCSWSTECVLTYLL